MYQDYMVLKQNRKKTKMSIFIFPLYLQSLTDFPTFFLYTVPNKFPNVTCPGDETAIDLLRGLPKSFIHDHQLPILKSAISVWNGVKCLV